MPRYIAIVLQRTAGTQRLTVPTVLTEHADTVMHAYVYVVRHSASRDSVGT